MTIWTKDKLIAHREQMGWPALTDDINNQVLAILNDAHETLELLEGVSWVEPDILFSIVTMCKNTK